MCTNSKCHNPFHCIVPPYMFEKMELAASRKRSLFAGTVKTRFNDELFRKKRALLTAMNTEQMNTVLPSLAISISRSNAAQPGPNRIVYDAQHTESQFGLPGKQVRKEGEQPVSDADVNNIYDNCGHTWDFYYNQFQRDSIDGKGLTLIHSVHFGNNYENAFWEGTQMVYGDGGEIFKSFTQDIDITGHELTHGVVQYEANLEYVGQSGAINESMADVFGVMVRQLALGEDPNDDNNWLIGRQCMIGNGYSLRSMASPGSAYKNHPILGDDPQPGNMANYKDLPNTQNGDYGGVHINSGIPNHAFYLVAKAIGGQPWVKAGKIWYAALCDPRLLTATSQFVDLVNATTIKAETLFGLNSPEVQAVKNAWQAVGL